MDSRWILLTLAAALAAPAAAGSTGSERNLEWLLAFAGLDAVPEGEALVHANGAATPTSAADAFVALAARARGVDLAEPVTDHPYGVGDVWVLEVGDAPCPTPIVYTPTPVPFMALHSGLWIYEGGAGAYETTQSDAGVIIDWTTKMSGGAYTTGGHTLAGQSDFYCVEFGDDRISFPFLDGVASANGDA